MKATEELADRFWKYQRSSPDDLRQAGLSVAIHNDYMMAGQQFTFWLMTGQHGGYTIALRGEGKTDQEALDEIRRQWANLTDHLHHAPMCPANHYCGQRAPTYHCTCGAKEES